MKQKLLHKWLWFNGIQYHALAKAKLTLLLMILAVFQVKANTIRAQEISLNVTQTEIAKILKKIEKQQNCRFIYRTDLASINKKIDFVVENKTIKEVLDKLFAGTNLLYKNVNNTLYAIYDASDANAGVTDNKVSGKVLNTAGEPLAGVSITVKGKKINAVTAADGSFSINADNNDVLVFTYVGYTTVEQKVTGNTISIILKASYNSIDEVVVVGYGTQKKKDLTGSITSVKGEEVARMPNTNPISSLQGRVPGLTVANSGVAGAAPVVRIRGVNSTSSANPVYVVDGILVDDIDFLNPADIESIDVLRDPSSIAIYGLRGANGVIAVTTKKAARGKTVVTLQSNVGVQVVHDRIALTDAEGFKKLYSAQLANLNAAPFDYTNYNANTNWQDLVLRNAIITSHNIGISNSGEKTTTQLNVGYTKQEGVLRNDDFTRYLVRFNQDVKITNNLKVGVGLNGYHFTNNPAGVSITNALWAAPIVPIQLNENTYYSMPSFQRAQVGNPMAALNRNDGNSINRGYRLLGNLFAEWKLHRNFTWKSIFYVDLEFANSRSYQALPFTFVNLGEGAAPTTTTFDNTQRTSVSQSSNEARRYQQDHTLTFEKTFNKKHNVTAIAGFTTIQNASSFLNGFRRDTALNIPNDPDLWYLGIVNVNNPISNGGGGTESAIAGAFTRVSYSYEGKYLVNATVRRDGSSKFAPKNRWGTFGSVGLGWVASNEKFFSNVKGINYLKIRGAWGLTGNANGFADNLWRPSIQNASTAIFGDNIYSSLQAAYIPDPNLRWETVRGLDIGFDIRLLKNKLSLDFTYYDRTTTDILTAVTLPNETRSYFTNLGNITNKGVEIGASYTENINKDLSITASANFSYNKNVVNSIGDNFNFAITGNGGANLTTTGQSIGYFYGYTQVGIYQSTADLAKQPAFPNSLPGDIAYADINGDGIISPLDRGFIGTPFPPYSFGSSLSVNYKDFDFLIEGQGAAGHKIYTQRRTATFATLNYEANRLNAWTGAGTSNIEPILDNTRGNNFLMSTYYLEPADFFRIRTLQLGYTLNQKMLSKIGIQKARLFVNAQNIKTFSRVTGYSPEPLIGSILGGGADNGAYPVPAVYSFGLNVTF